MSVAKVEIDNYKSIRHCEIDFRDINLFIGENGTGKSNILEAVQCFYGSLLNETDDRECYNYLNRFSNEFSISVTFDFRHLKRISMWNLSRGYDSEFQGYYDWIARRKPFETLTMRKIKDKPIHWNRERKYRQNILNLFPLYAVDARQVDLTDWRQLWDIIGDLMKVHRSRESEISSEISAIKDKGEYKLEERFRRLSESFERANVKIMPFTPKEYASTISTLLFKGDVFSIRESGLDYMSNGTNAFNYTNLLIEILKLISEFKLKDPVVILDEPELSLHHKLIDQLTSRVLGCGSSMRFLIATHSPRLLKNVLKLEESNCQVIHVSIYGGYTRAVPIRLFSQAQDDDRPRVFMMDQHANAYFSRYILSVEGASETELFSNGYLQELYPCLKDVDIMEGMSDDVIQKIISPRQRHFETRFLLLTDMDKAIVKVKGSNSFKPTGKYFSRKNPPQERYYYTKERDEQLWRLKRIRLLADKGRFHYWFPFFSCKDRNYWELIELIKEYLLERNLYVASTTVEGMLITYSGLTLFWNWCMGLEHFQRDKQELDDTYTAFLKNDRLNFVRLLFSGKSDYILNLSEIIAENPKMDSGLVTLMRQNQITKTSGWISAWLDYYFKMTAADYREYISGPEEMARRMDEEPEFRYAMRRDLRRDMPELWEMLDIINRQINKR